MTDSQGTQSNTRRNAFAITVLVVLVTGVFLIKSQADKRDGHEAGARPALTRADASASIPASGSPPAEADENLTGRAAGVVFSDFVGSIQSQLLTMSLAGQIYMAKIKQDVSFRDLQAFRNDAEAMKAAVQDAAGKIGVIPAPGNVTDADSEYFEKARTAALDLVSLNLDIAVDISVNANTGMNAFDDVRDADKKARHLRKNFDDAVMRGYEHFGYKHSEIDATAMTLKK